MSSINPLPEQFKALFANTPAGVPIVMLNLLRFRDVAVYADGAGTTSGKQAYARYSALAMQHVERIGGKVLWAGRAHSTVIGPPDEQWDEVLLVQYPSVEAFAAMVTHAEYQALAVHRTAAVADSRLICTVALPQAS